jgi:hypothetical protein
VSRWRSGSLQSSHELLYFVFLFPLCVVLPNRDRDPFIDDLGQDKSAEMKINGIS